MQTQRVSAVSFLLMISGMVYNKKKSKIKSILMGVLVALIWIAVWQIIYKTVDREVLIASPLSVFRRLLELVVEKSFWVKILNSLISVFKGYFLALIVGTALAIMTSASKILYALFKPLLSIIRSTPVASFIILAWIWMSKQSIPVFTSFLMVTPIVWASITTGIKSTDSDLLEMAHIYKISKTRILKNIYIPSVMPSFISCATTGIGFAWKSAVAAEVLSLPKNTIGIELYNSKVYLETVDMFAWTVVIIVLSLILEKLLVYLINMFIQRKDLIK